MRKHDEEQQISKLINKSLIPNFTSELSLSATSIVDGIVTGYFYGSKGLAAVGLGGPILSVFTIVAGLLGTGNSVLCTRLMGESSQKESNRIFSLSVIWALLLSFVMTSLTIGGADVIAHLFSGTTKKELVPAVTAYIRGFSMGAPFIIFRQLLAPMVNIEGGNKHIHVSSVLILGGDALLDYIFAAFFHGGTFGMGAASALSYVLGCIPFFLFFVQKKTSLKLDFKHCFSWAGSFEVFKAGFPTAVKRFCNVLAPVLTNRFILLISSVGAMAALSVQTSATRFPLCLVLALSTTTLLIAGTFFGEADRKQMESGMKEMMCQILYWSVGIAVVFFVFAKPIAFVFIKDEKDVVDMAAYAIRWFVIGVPFMAINQCAASYLQATKRLRASNLVIIADRLISTIVLVYLLGWLFGEKGVFAAYGLSEAALTIVLYVFVCVKNGGPITSFDQLLMLPDDFGVSKDDLLYVSFHSTREVAGFSQKIQNFCLEKGADKRRAFFVGLSVEELAVNVLTHGITSQDQNLIVRIFVNNKDEIVIRLRDDGIPFNLEERQKIAVADIEDPTKNIGIRLVFNMAREVSYNASYGMNNTMIII